MGAGIPPPTLTLVRRGVDLMGIWSVLFPGDEGLLADLFWSNQQTSSGISLKNQVHRGTAGDDTVSFAQLSLSYNPYQSEVYLLEGNDTARTVGTASGTKFYLGDGDDFFTAIDGLRYSRIEGGRGDDTIRIKESLWDREGLFQSIITTDTGSDYILIEKEDRLADSRSGVLGGGIFSGDGDDRLIIRGNGLLVQSSGTSLTYEDGSISRDGIINLGEGNDFLGIEKWNTLPPTGSKSTGSSPYLLNSDIDLGGGDDTVDLRFLDFSSSTGVLIKGGEGYDVVVLPLNVIDAPNLLQGFEGFTYALNNGNGTPGTITSSTPGVFQEGVTLTAPLVTGDPDGDATNPNYAYKWFKGSTAITGATALTYAVPASGAGTYKVAVTYTDAQGFRSTADSPNQVITEISIPSYKVTPSATLINEGATLVTSVATTSVAKDTTLYYSLSGRGIASTDFSSGLLSGSEIVGADGKLSFSHTLANDSPIEGYETVEIKIFSDGALTNQLGFTTSVYIADVDWGSITAWTGNSLLPTTTVSENLGIINFMPPSAGPKYYWSLTGEGVNEEDFLKSGSHSEKIVFSGIRGENYRGQNIGMSFQFRPDEKKENESITFKLFSDAEMLFLAAAPLTIQILDSLATYSLNPPTSSLSEGSILTTVVTTDVPNATTLYWTVAGTGITAADFSAGSLMGSGTVGTDGKFSISHTIANDLTTEGAESIEIKLFTDSSRSNQVGTIAPVSISDTSQTPTNNGDGTPGAITSSTPSVFQEGVTLSAPVVTSDPDGDATSPNYSYQWFKDSTAITNATASTYVVPVTGAGTYKVAVTYTDGLGYKATVESPEQVVSILNNGNGTIGSITSSTFGDHGEGATLSAPGVTNDPDGDAENPNYSYQWFKDGTVITNAIAFSYSVPVTGGGTYKVAVTYPDAQGFITTLESAPITQSAFPEQPLNVEWERSLGGALSESAVAVSIGESGTTAVAGFTNSFKGFDNQLYNGGDADIFVSLFNESGEKRWTRIVGGSYSEYAYEVRIDSLEKVHILGKHSQGGILSVKIASAGEIEYSKQIPFSGYVKDASRGIDGSVFATGRLNGDVVVAKYDSQGNKKWQTIIGTTWEDHGYEIIGDSEGGAYVTGFTQGDLSGETNASEISDAFLSRLDSEGNLLWTRLVGESRRATGDMLVVDKAGSVYLGGFTLQGSSEKLFLARYTADGEQVWKRQYDVRSTEETQRLTEAPKGGVLFVDDDKIIYFNEDGRNQWFAGGDDPGRTINAIDVSRQGDIVIGGYINSMTDAFIARYITSAPSNASPVVNSTLPALSTNRGSAFTYTFRSDLFTDPDSTLTLSATTATGASLPSWLSFNPATRTLSGTPSSSGTVALNISASDGLTSVSTPLELKIREVQLISSLSKPITYQRNKDLMVPINYSTTDGSKNTGISFNVYFNSSLLSFDVTTGIANKVQVDLFNVGAIQADTANSDGDSSTDKFIPISLASFSGNFLSNTTPTKLADLTFKAADKSIDPITGLRNTNINFTEIEAAQGYGFSSISASLTPLSFNLDVDGDGKVTALGDGLMIIRKLFGSAFAGDALTNKAISSTATRNTSQIHDFIQQGIDSGLLDVDKDLRTTALGDGLMLIRRLFGAAFSGSALTDKAISPDSPHLNGSSYNLMTIDQKISISGLIGGNIDALRPSSGIF